MTSRHHPVCIYAVIGQPLILAGTVRTPGTVGTGWQRRGGEDSRLMRHVPMDWTVGTFGTVGNDALDAGDCLADAGNSLGAPPSRRHLSAEKKRLRKAWYRNRSAIDIGCTTCLCLARWDATCLANVAPSRRNSNVLSYPGLRRPPGASSGAMHGAALRAELGRSDDVLCPIRGRKPPSFNFHVFAP